MTPLPLLLSFPRFFALTGGLVALAVLATPPAAGQNGAPVRIEEVLYDGTDSDTDDVFTEITGPPGKALTGWSLVGINGGDGQPYRTIDLSGATIPADGVLVVAHANAAGAVLTHRDTTANVDWQNGPDAVQLLNTQDGVVDTVDALQYGDAGQYNAGEGNPAPQVTAGQSLSGPRTGRIPATTWPTSPPRTAPRPGPVGPHLRQPASPRHPTPAPQLRGPA